MASNKKERAVHLLEGFKNLSKVDKSTTSYKKLARVAVAIVLVAAIGTSIWFASPTTDTAVAANNEGFLYNNQEEYNKAIIAFNKAIDLDPSFAPAYNNRGWAYIELGQYEQAIADYDKAIELDPNLSKMTS